MAQDKGHLKSEFGNSVADIVRSVESAQDKNLGILFAGLGLFLSTFFMAQIAPPKVVLPLMDVTLAAIVGRKGHQKIETEFAKAYDALDATEQLKLLPLKKILIDDKAPSLSDSFDLLKNWKQATWSTAGGFILNPALIPGIYCGVMHKDEFDRNDKIKDAVNKVAERWQISF